MLVSSRERVKDTQTYLWEPQIRLDKMAKTRFYCGDFFEKKTAEITGGIRLRTDARCDVCPDIRYSADTYFEVKSIGNSCQAIIYQHRMARDKAWTTEKGVSLYYWFWSHNVRAVDVATVEELELLLAGGVQEVFVLDLATVHGLVKDRPVKTMNYSNKTGKRSLLGYGINGYGSGWSLTLKQLREACTASAVIPPGTPWLLGDSAFSRFLPAA